jgi:2-iminobutanoate/2-iminopropanoate deaminase
MTPEVVKHPDLPRPLGPYSPVVRVGDLLFVSAQAGVDPSTGCPPAGGFEAECRQALANLDRALRASGSDLRHVVKSTVFYTRLDDFPTLNKVYAEAFPTAPPARSAVIGGLPGGRQISIDAIAVTVTGPGQQGGSS